jgi:UDP-N-acetylglucosamine 2-epimerase (non-hydrolysing)
MQPVVHLIAATRPNFMKVAPLYHELMRTGWCRPLLIQTGQHFDWAMSDGLRLELGLPHPDVDLGVRGGTHGEQTAGVLLAYERLCLIAPPSWVVVVGDVDSTLACALAAKKLNILVSHLEAGLRSHDRSMPEEINRIVVDAMADLLWTPSADADENLLREGVPAERIERVGNIMIDAYEMLRERIEAERTANRMGLLSGSFGVVTLHRPANVDDAPTLGGLVEMLSAVAVKLQLVFPVHPRTRRRLERFGFWDRLAKVAGLISTPPLGYIAFMSLVRDSRLAITDSGGVQEETTYLGIPCLTLRTTTERPVTIAQGTNRLVDSTDLLQKLDAALHGDWPCGACPELWDGRTAERVSASLRRRMLS